MEKRLYMNVGMSLVELVRHYGEEFKHDFYDIATSSRTAEG